MSGNYLKPFLRLLAVVVLASCGSEDSATPASKSGEQQAATASAEATKASPSTVQQPENTVAARTSVKTTKTPSPKTVVQAPDKGATSAEGKPTFKGHTLELVHTANVVGELEPCG